MQTDRATEMTKLIVNLQNFANAPKNYSKIAVPDMNIVKTAIFWDVTTCMPVDMS